MVKVLKSDFFNRPTLIVAQELLGKFLVRRFRGKIVRKIILEVEAYDGFKDRASHASRGLTERNKTMFGPAGYFYVYFTYGMHWMLNIVVGPKNHPAAILIRGVTANTDRHRLENRLTRINGPGRLTKFLKINKSFNGKKASVKTGLWFENKGIKINPKLIKRSARIGVEYAGKFWSQKKYRFYLEYRLL